jgi:mannonate dehydratase
MKQPLVNRRNALQILTAAAALAPARPAQAAQPNRGQAPLKITDVKTILTQPTGGGQLVVVKVMTNEPGLYGVGCATHQERRSLSPRPSTII